MQMIAQYELQRVLARRQFDRGFRLATTEMHMVCISRNCFAWCWQWRVDDQMMVAGVGPINASRCDTETAETEHHVYGTCHDCAVGR